MAQCVAFGVPSGWKVELQEMNDGRQIYVAVDPADTDTNLFCAFTPLQAD